MLSTYSDTGPEVLDRGSTRTPSHLPPPPARPQREGPPGWAKPAAPPPEPPRSGRFATWLGGDKRRTFGLVAAAIAVGFALFQWWSNERARDEASDNLRDLGASEQQIDEVEGLWESEDFAGVDANDGVITDEEIRIVREMADIWFERDNAAGFLTDTEIRDIGLAVCDALPTFDHAVELEMWAFGLAADYADDPADTQVVSGVAGGASGTACLDEALDIPGMSGG